MLFTVKPRKLELQFFETLINSIFTDKLNSENGTFLWYILITVFLSVSQRCSFYAPKTYICFDGEEGDTNNCFWLYPEKVVLSAFS